MRLKFPCETCKFRAQYGFTILENGNSSTKTAIILDEPGKNGDSSKKMVKIVDEPRQTTKWPPSTLPVDAGVAIPRR